MTAEQFLERLRYIRNEFDWNLEPDTGWFTEGRAARRGWLRARPHAGPAAGALLEPIGALCYVLTGKAFGERSWSSAARALGLEASGAADLHRAADSCTWDATPEGRQPVERLRTLRRELLDAVGLSRN